MSHEQVKDRSDEWFTPKYVFDALGCKFDLDVASPVDRRFVSVPSTNHFTENSLEREWKGFVWMNPPFGDADNKLAWLKKFFEHGNGIGLTPDRTCAEWWHYAIERSDSVLFCKSRINFILPDGTKGSGAGANSCLWASGEKAVKILDETEKTGFGRVMITKSKNLSYGLI